jgi:glycolate oxidase iron-sulfur subunit
MQTRFSDAQRADPAMASSEKVLRSCVHCGFCLATCPTYVLLGDELDSPRGRIYQIQAMLEAGGAPAPETVKHVDRCLSCLSCMTTCPSGVNYMRLVDHARSHIETHYRRPLLDRVLRQALSVVLTRPWLFRTATRAAAALRWAKRLAPVRFAPLFDLAPDRLPEPDATTRPGLFAAEGPRRLRVALLSGCVQPALAPQINAAAVRLLNRHGVEVVIANSPCCGALPHHLGKAERAHALAAAQIRAWRREIEADGLEAIVITTSGCGTTIKDYGFMFRNDPDLAGPAARVSALAVDITELMARLGLASPAPAPAPAQGLTVAYHAACSLQHGQSVREAPKRLLEAAGFRVVEPAEPHLCCGSAGTYNLLQPEIAGRLRARKVVNLESVGASVIATGNIGCMTQIGAASGLPVVHTAELLDWATGGPRPAAMSPTA